MHHCFLRAFLQRSGRDGAVIGFAAHFHVIRPLPCHSANIPAAKRTRTLRYRLRGHASLFFACFSAAKRTRALRDGLRCAKQQVTSLFLAAKRTRRSCDRLRRPAPFHSSPSMSLGEHPSSEADQHPPLWTSRSCIIVFCVFFSSEAYQNPPL